MIVLTRLNGTQVVVNAELIELIETTPDTLVTLTTGNKINVREPVAAVVGRVLEYRRQCHPSAGPAVAPPCGDDAPPDDR